MPATTATVAQGEKENASLHQSTLDKSIAQKRKRTVMLNSGESVDLTRSGLVPSPELVEAMRLRIIELEDELNLQPPPAKRARTKAAATAETADPVNSTSTPTATSVKADEKKRKLQVKKIFDRLKKECKADGVKFQGSSKTLKVDEVFEEAEFQSLTVTIIHFNTQAQISEFFSDELKTLKGNTWTRGGGPSFSKSIKTGACDVTINSFEVNYSKNGMKCTIKFGVEGEGGGGCYFGGRGHWDLY
ncbi:hypothetical protein BDQ12DRAFT_705322 [Crucibulum laeve]|uniref:Uncharacterized protein n=1 Tax=Crucibulum laeve TaxID=68775 RepID=A0A5C3M3K1_9AGAR|nr:hypothetical protein BDQ12DRAFT_705322 [Crucibulum laeve]